MTSILVIALFVLLMGLLLLIVFWSWMNGISPMPSSRKATRTLLKTIPENFVGEILELGSGWGDLAFTLATTYPTSSVVAYETSLVPYWVSRLRVYLGCYPNLKILRKDFFKANFNESGLVVCYLFPKAMQKLSLKFEGELPKNAYILTNTFSIPGWKPLQTIVLDDLYRTHVFLYQKL